MTDRAAVLAEIEAAPATPEVKARAKALVLKLPDDIRSPSVGDDDVLQDDEIPLCWYMISCFEPTRFSVLVCPGGYVASAIKDGSLQHRQVVLERKVLLKRHLAILREMLAEPKPRTKKGTKP